jgi:ribosomal protein S27AE
MEKQAVQEEPEIDRPDVKNKDISEYCPQCGVELFGNHCKLICPRCGYYMSCSDYY